MGKSWIWKILSNHVRPHAVRPRQNVTNRKRMKLRSASQTWNSPVQPATLQITGHSEPVLKLVWESPSSLRPCPTKDGDCHTSDIGHWFAMTCKSGQLDRFFERLGAAHSRQRIPGQLGLRFLCTFCRTNTVFFPFPGFGSLPLTYAFFRVIIPVVVSRHPPLWAFSSVG